MMEWKHGSAVAEDGTVWTISPFPNYGGSATSVLLSSTRRGITLHSCHLSVATAQSHADELQKIGWL